MWEIKYNPTIALEENSLAANYIYIKCFSFSWKTLKMKWICRRKWKAKKKAKTNDVARVFNVDFPFVPSIFSTAKAANSAVSSTFFLEYFFVCFYFPFFSFRRFESTNYRINEQITKSLAALFSTEQIIEIGWLQKWLL